MRRAHVVAAAALAALALVPTALAAGGDYAVDGGTRFEQAQVRSALDASSFDWSVVPARIQVHIVPGAWPHATRGEIWLDPQLLDAGVFSWAVVQDEYAHQVDFYVLDDADRQVLMSAFRAPVWCHGDDVGLPHGAYGCERFTSTFVWSYWPSARNAYKPVSPSDESASMPPSKFRALLDSLLRRSPAANLAGIS
jgi:hypothetical protein